MPSGRPFRNSIATFQGAGITAKPTSANQEAPINPRIAPPRRLGLSSEITLMPMNFDSA